MNDKYIECFDMLINAVSEEDFCCQLAEECAELAQAALKMRRVITGSNPTPVTKEEALKNLKEELADVHLAIEMAFEKYDISMYEINDIQEEKLERWRERLDGRHGAE